MELLNEILNVLTTPNMNLVNLLSIPFVFIEMTVTMLLFTVLLNVKVSSKSKLIYVTSLSIFSVISNFFIPKSVSSILNIIIWPFFAYFIFRIGLKKCIIAELIHLSIIITLDTILGKVFYVLFSANYNTLLSIPICRLLIVSIIYLTIFILYRMAKHFKFNLTTIASVDKKTLILNYVPIIVVIITQIILTQFYNDSLPIFIIITNIITLVIYFFISFYNFSKSCKLQITTQELESTKAYNKSLNLLLDNIRGFKHDFHNIVNAIGSYIATDDTAGLKEYYKDLFADCQTVNNLTTLNPEVINNPSVFGILADKYFKADSKCIKLSFEIVLDLNKLNINIYHFTRILGILMDNAIDAAEKCEKKEIHVTIRKDFRVARQLLIIENTYSDKNVNIDKIFEKGYTSKPTEEGKIHGLGLWEVRQILKKNNNLNLYTYKTDDYFIQQLEIYP